MGEFARPVEDEDRDSTDGAELLGDDHARDALPAAGPPEDAHVAGEAVHGDGDEPVFFMVTRELVDRCVSRCVDPKAEANHPVWVRSVPRRLVHDGHGWLGSQECREVVENQDHEPEKRRKPDVRPELRLGHLVMKHRPARDYPGETPGVGNPEQGALADPIQTKLGRRLVDAHRTQAKGEPYPEVRVEHSRREDCCQVDRGHGEPLVSPADRDAALVHLDLALGADELPEEAPHPPLWAAVTVELATAGALPRDPAAEPADLLVAVEAESSDQFSVSLSVPIKAPASGWRDGRQVREQGVGQDDQDDAPDEHPLPRAPPHVSPVQDGAHGNQEDACVEGDQGGGRVDARHRDVELGGELLRKTSDGRADVRERL